jgi:hypothetical protein
MGLPPAVGEVGGGSGCLLRSVRSFMYRCALCYIHMHHPAAMVS